MRTTLLLNCVLAVLAGMYCISGWHMYASVVHIQFAWQYAVWPFGYFVLHKLSSLILVKMLDDFKIEPRPKLLPICSAAGFMLNNAAIIGSGLMWILCVVLSIFEVVA